MTLLEVVIDEPEVARAEALVEYQKLGLTEADLVQDLGEKETYEGMEVVRALGY